MLRWSTEKLQDAVRVLQFQIVHQRTRNSLQNTHFSNPTTIKRLECATKRFE